jgi:hypothetical protein
MYIGVTTPFVFAIELDLDDLCVLVNASHILLFKGVPEDVGGQTLEERMLCDLMPFPFIMNAYRVGCFVLESTVLKLILASDNRPT